MIKRLCKSNNNNNDYKYYDTKSHEYDKEFSEVKL